MRLRASCCLPFFAVARLLPQILMHQLQVQKDLLVLVLWLLSFLVGQMLPVVLFPIAILPLFVLVHSVGMQVV
jgi:hypothetical protein